MGCKESKHKAIAEGNTIITPSSSRKSMSRGQSSSIKNSVPSFHRSRSTRSSTKKQDSLKKINVGDSKANDVIKQNENPGYEKGTVNVSKVLEDEDRRLKQLNDQIDKSQEKEVVKGKNDGVDTNIEKKENENADEEEKEGFVIPKVNLSSSSRKDGEGIESIITDGLSGTSVYYTPTEASGPFANNTKSENDEDKPESTEEKQESAEEKQQSTEEKQQSIEEIKDTKSAEGVTEDNTIKNVDATPMKNVEEAEVAEKKPIETDCTTPGNQDNEEEVVEKIKVAEAAIAALENLVKEADKTKDNDATIQNPVKETEEIPVTEGEITDATLEKPVIEADKSDSIRETEAESTDATLQNPKHETNKSEEIPEIELEATDATLSYPVIESDRAEEILLKDDGEAVENGVKEIHEVADKVGEIPAKEAESTDATNNKTHELVSDKTEDVQEKEAAIATAEDPVKEVEVADQVKNLMTEVEAVSIHKENPAKKLENMTKDEANTEETKDEANTEETKDEANTEEKKNSSSANVHQISTEDPDNK